MDAPVPYESLSTLCAGSYGQPCPTKGLLRSGIIAALRSLVASLPAESTGPKLLPPADWRWLTVGCKCMY
jgi:hypothetical protein